MKKNSSNLFNPPFKIEILSNPHPLFKNLVGGSTPHRPLAERGGGAAGGAHYANKIGLHKKKGIDEHDSFSFSSVQYTYSY